MAYATHIPAAAASWPILLLAGVDHSEVVAEAAKAAAATVIDRTLWVPIGRDEPTCPHVEVVEHGGTYRDILGAVAWAGTEAATGEYGTVLLVGDCTSVLWSMLHTEARLTIDERAAAHGFPITPAGVEISRDLWDSRSQRWHRFMNVVRRHPGPVLLTAYLDEVALTNEAGDRTTSTRWELQAEKNLARSVSGMVQWRGGDPVLSGLPDVEATPDLTVPDIWAALALTAETPPAPRPHAHAVPVSYAAERASVLAQVAEAAHAAGEPRGEIAAAWANSHAGQRIDDPAADLDELERVRDALRARAIEQDEPPTQVADPEPDPA